MIRAGIVRWITENFRSVNIVKDRQLRDLLLAGHPGAKIPCPNTVSKDLNESFKKCKKKVEHLLKVGTT
jgi:hypothetical protein